MVLSFSGCYLGSDYKEDKTKCEVEYSGLRRTFFDASASFDNASFQVFQLVVEPQVGVLVYDLHIQVELRHTGPWFSWVVSKRLRALASIVWRSLNSAMSCIRPA